ncbi:STAS domain-containing protein [uncultured Mycobacterium sp.]|uniref:STAS domain-containing protein n=1 Tax=uncultured Mycobacterium sp. TaxID=171292 RepID=UPI0035CC99ED
MSHLAVSAQTVNTTCLLTADGVLDSTTYLWLRDAIIKAALDEPRAVIIDVDALAVPAPSAWAVFTSAHWHVCTWPGVPIVLVCVYPDRRAIIARNGIARYVPVHPTIESALHAVANGRLANRLRVCAELPGSLKSLARARALVAESLTNWSQSQLISVATVIVNVFVENVLMHTASTPVLVLETDGKTVTVAVQDGSSGPAERREAVIGSRRQVSGLEIVSALCRAWGNTPTPSGKTVWAVIGPENQL